MNTMKSLLLSAAIALTTWITACNYTVGECWPVGQGGGSSEGVTAGGGVIIPTGPSGGGGFGDEPPKQPQDARDPAPLECNATDEETDKEQSNNENNNSPDDGSYEAGLKVFCKKPDFGSTCSERCFAKGIGCVSLAVHPQKPDGGIGKLFSCNDLTIGFMCGYHYENGDDCYYPHGLPFPKVCSYSGND
jgi:hypothetical protein